MRREADAGMLLIRALEQSASAAGCPITILRSSQRRWASATFAGARHNLEISATGSPMLDGWLAALPETDFTLPGQLVADLIVSEIRREGESIVALVEVLTVESR